MCHRSTAFVIINTDAVHMECIIGDAKAPENCVGPGCRQGVHGTHIV